MPFERWLCAWRVRFRILIDRDGVDRELDDELRHHVALETEARRAQGVPLAEARRQALAALGGLESVRNHVREARFGASLEHVLQDVRYVLRRGPGGGGSRRARRCRPADLRTRRGPLRPRQGVPRANR